jgi:predicted 3-demethylubiquinone-9 3-methyltransferase (glyoxalase superfamily)
MQKITPFSWFDDQAAQAAKFYVSLFKKSNILGVTRYAKGGPQPKGKVMTVRFELQGLQFTALNAGPQFKFTEAISFSVDCKNQKEGRIARCSTSAGPR